MEHPSLKDLLNSPNGPSIERAVWKRLCHAAISEDMATKEDIQRGRVVLLADNCMDVDNPLQVVLKWGGE